ncbi:MAG: hypothetical protein EOO63_05875 [Hymenobacter sp.]|nr:MAG: hypothetical protein EOO63_05875 [Hymenobacter sp.]
MPETTQQPFVCAQRPSLNTRTSSMKKQMEEAKYAIVYLAHGLESTKYQAVLSIYSLYYQLGGSNQDYRFIIYTDSDRTVLDKYLSGFPVTLEVLSNEQMKRFKGPENYIFRVKPAVIKDYFSKYKQTLLYMDTDTYFLRDPTPLLQSIKPGHSLMNAQEYDFVDAGLSELEHWFILRQGLKRHTYTVAGQQVTIPASTVMWNAGIIGLNQADAGLVDQYLSLTDEMFSRCKTFIVEQFVASYVLQTVTQLSSTEDYIDHYWSKGVKHTFNLRLPAFLKQHAGLQGMTLYKQAFAFAQETRPISTPYRLPLTDRISTRLKLIMKVARQGYL